MSKKAVTRDESASFNIYSGITSDTLMDLFGAALQRIQAACEDGEAVQWDRLDIDTSTDFMDDSTFMDSRRASWRTVRIDAPIVKVETTQ